MSATEEITYAEVANHSSKKDLYLVIHDTVYNASSFVDEHPYVPPKKIHSSRRESRALFFFSKLPATSPHNHVLSTMCTEDPMLINYMWLSTQGR